MMMRALADSAQMASTDFERERESDGAGIRVARGGRWRPSDERAL